MAKRTATGADGRRYIEDGRGGWREMGADQSAGAIVDLPEQMAENVAAGQARAGNEEYISNEPGTNFGTRFVMKNFAKNVGTARAYLESLGYEVRQYSEPGITDPFPFWVRKGPTNAWKPVDPPGSESPLEFLRDALDVTVDAVSGVLQGTAGIAGSALPGGPATGMATAELVGTAANYAQDTAGAMLGIPQEASVTESAINAVPGAIMSGLPQPAKIPAKFTGGVYPKPAPGPVSRGAVQLMAKTAGTTPELLRERAKIAGYGLLTKMDVPLARIRELFRRYDAGEERLPMSVEADEIITQAKAKGIGIDARPLLSRMDDYTLHKAPPPVDYSKVESPYNIYPMGGIGPEDAPAPQTPSKVRMRPRTVEGAAAHVLDESLPVLIKKKRQRIQDLIEANGFDEADVPPDFYATIKRSLQDIAAGKGEYANNKVSSVTADVFGKFARVARLTLEDAMDATGIISPVTKKPYSHVMADLDRTVGTIGKVRDALYRGKTDARQIKAAQGQIKMLHGDLAGLENSKLLRELDRSLGTGLDEQFKRAGVIHLKKDQLMAEVAEEASLGSKFSENFGLGGKPNLIPRFGAQGKPINPVYSTATTLGGAAYLGHPLLGAAALAAGSPTSQLFAMKAAHKVGEAMPGFVNVVGRAATSGTGKAALATTLKSIQERK